MTSLNYSTQHHIWQQRLAKEARDAHLFQSRYLPKSQSARVLSEPLTAPPLPSNPNLLRDEPFHHNSMKHSVVAESTAFAKTDSNLSNALRSSLSRSNWTNRPLFQYRGPAEIRGKYSRPASLIEQTGQIDTLENPLLSRPVTSGSLVRKHSRQFSPALMPQTTTETLAKPLSAAGSHKSFRIRTSREVTTSVALKRTTSAPLPDEAKQPGPEKESVAPCAEATKEEAKAGASNDEVQSIRPASSVTWKTSSSQRKYIEELEALLKDERKRRILAEAKLSSLEGSEN